MLLDHSDNTHALANDNYPLEKGLSFDLNRFSATSRTQFAGASFGWAWHRKLMGGTVPKIDLVMLSKVNELRICQYDFETMVPRGDRYVSISSRHDLYRRGIKYTIINESR